jgi:Ankyrin repeats (3 copies)
MRKKKLLLFCVVCILHESYAGITLIDLVSTTIVLDLKDLKQSGTEQRDIIPFITAALSTEQSTRFLTLMRQSKPEFVISVERTFVATYLYLVIPNLIDSCKRVLLNEHVQENPYKEFVEGEKALISNNAESVEQSMKKLSILLLPFALTTNTVISSFYLRSGAELLLKLCNALIKIRESGWFSTAFTIEPKDIDSFGLSLLIAAALNKRYTLKLDNQIALLEKYFAPILIQSMNLFYQIYQKDPQTQQIHELPLAKACISLAKVIGIALTTITTDRKSSVLGFVTKNNTLLHIAAWNRNPPAIATLLQEGLNINAQNSYGFTPLMILVSNCITMENAIKSFNALIEYKDKPNLDLKDTLNGMTALHWAAFHCPQFVEPLLRAGAKKTITNNVGQLPRDLAEKYGNTAAVEILDAWPNTNLK